MRKIPLLGASNEFSLQPFDMARRFCQRTGRFEAKIAIFVVFGARGFAKR
jgi:hypothetical protein